MNCFKKSSCWFGEFQNIKFKEVVWYVIYFNNGFATNCDVFYAGIIST